MPNRHMTGKKLKTASFGVCLLVCLRLHHSSLVSVLWSLVFGLLSLVVLVVSGLWSLFFGFGLWSWLGFGLDLGLGLGVPWSKLFWPSLLSLSLHLSCLVLVLYYGCVVLWLSCVVLSWSCLFFSRLVIVLCRLVIVSSCLALCLVVVPSMPS
jgi:hypothetical protein